MKRWLPYVFFTVAIGVFFGVILWLPFKGSDKFDQATLIRICRDGTPILRTKDGTVWARRTVLFAYRVEDDKTVCAP